MASWAEGRTGRRLVLQVSPEIKCHLIKIKALTGTPMGSQVCSALKTVWSNPNMPIALRPSSPSCSQSPAPPLFETVPSLPPASPPIPPQSHDPYSPILPGRYDRMRKQPIDRANIPWKV